MGRFKAKLVKTYPLGDATKTKRSWGRYFDAQTGFSLRLPRGYSISIFIDRRLKPGSAERLRAFLARDQVPARCLSCVGEEWELRTEPTGKGQVGMVMYTSKGKALAAGTASVTERGEIQFALATLYPGMTNRANIEYGCKGKGKSDGGWEVE